MNPILPRSFPPYCIPVILTTFLLALLVSSCGTSPTSPVTNPSSTVTSPVPQTLASSTNTPTILLGPSPTPTNTPPDPELQDSTSSPFIPLPHYTITATLNYAQHILQVDQRIDYANPSTDSLTELVLMVDAIYFPGVFNLKTIEWVDSLSPASYSWDNAILHVQLPQPLIPGEQLSLHLSYALTLPSPVPSVQVRPIPFGYTVRQTNLVDWYPFVAPYRSGEGEPGSWLAHPAGFFGEHLVYPVADFDVSIRLEDARTDLIVAASTPALETDGWRRYHMEKARNFAWSVSPEYIVASTQVGQTTMTSYTFPYHATAGETVLKTTADALSLFSELFGPYPRSALSVVEADFLDGMEYDGLYFLSNGFYNLYQGNPGEYLVAISAHETAHMWWYALVGNDQALEPWLDEALCTYSELLFYERYHPSAIDWWWAYRINYYEPRGWVDGSIYNPDGYRAYRDAAYLNGAVFLDELRQAIGPDTFTRFLHAYSTQSTYQIVTAHDFFSLISDISPADISTLKGKYFSSTP